MTDKAKKHGLLSQFSGVAGTAFLKKYSQIVYAIILIILIPLVIILNTVFVIRRFSTNSDYQLQRQSLIISEVIDATAFDTPNDIATIQKNINELFKGPEELRSIDVIIPEGDGYTIAASSIQSNIGKAYTDFRSLIAWSTDRGVAFLTKATSEDAKNNPELAGQRYWNALFPLHDKAGNKTALLDLKMSLKVTDQLAQQTVMVSILLLLLTLAVVIGLLLLNTKLFQYTVLFKKLEEVDKMKDEFISMASHELRTPITAIRGYISMFIDGSFGAMSDAGKKGLNIIEVSTRRLGDLVEDLLNVSRIEQKRMPISPERVNALEIINQTIDELKITATAKNLSLFYEGQTDLPAILADKDKLRQILVNLIGNAIKYTKEGSVTVSAKQKESMLLIKTKDTGIGISAKDREQLFTKFYRVANEETKGIVGTGLGLWITKQLIELMGGEIYVDSIEGSGTEFNFTMPLFTETQTKSSKTTEKA